jgi:hypothetical protein
MRGEVTPIRIQRKRTKGWKMPENTVYVGRGTLWGNPFRAGVHYDHQHAVDLHREYFFSCVECRATSKQQERIYKEGGNFGQFFAGAALVKHLAGKNLACWCALDQPCHAEVLLELANAPALSLKENVNAG